MTKLAEFGTLHVDTKVRLEIDSIHAHFVTIVEDLSIYVEVHRIQSKGDSADKFLHYIKYFEKQYVYKVLKSTS